MREAHNVTGTPPTVRPVATSIEAAVGPIEDREPLDHTDGKSGAMIERITAGGETYVLKHLDVAVDWTLRAAGDVAGMTLELWRRGLLDRLPDCINQPIVAVVHDPSRGVGARGTTLIMRDVGRWLVPAGDDPIAEAQHLAFLDHLAAAQAEFWNAGPEIDLLAMSNRYMALSPWLALTEAAIGSDALIPRLVGQGWDRLPEVAPALAEVLVPLAWEPHPLIAAFGDTPTTLLHGNWKFGNLGTDDDGRTVVIDWEDPGRGPALVELGWYLAINSARLPVSKEATIEAFRDALERHGVATDPWWDRQLRLALVGAMVHFGWEKALGGPGDELDWWSEQVQRGVGLIG